jgi:hypothetical protein
VLAVGRILSKRSMTRSNSDEGGKAVAWGGAPVSAYGNFLPGFRRFHGKKFPSRFSGAGGADRSATLGNCCVVLVRLTEIGSAVSQYAIIGPIGARRPGR